MKTVKFGMVLSHAFFAAGLGLSLIISGCGAIQTGNSGIPGPSSGGNPTDIPGTAAVSFCNAAQTNCQAQSANFSMATSNIPDLNIKVDWASVLPGPHSQEIRLMMPNGNLFQRLQDTFMVAANGNGTATVNRNIPIAGSFISQRQITGGWKVEVSLDGKAKATGDLQLNP
jgi:hypothetical protein